MNPAGANMNTPSSQRRLPSHFTQAQPGLGTDCRSQNQQHAFYDNGFGPVQAAPHPTAPPQIQNQTVPQSHAVDVFDDIAAALDPDNHAAIFGNDTANFDFASFATDDLNHNMLSNQTNQLSNHLAFAPSGSHTAQSPGRSNSTLHEEDPHSLFVPETTSKPAQLDNARQHMTPTPAQLHVHQGQLRVQQARQQMPFAPTPPNTIPSMAQHQTRKAPLNQAPQQSPPQPTKPIPSNDTADYEASLADKLLPQTTEKRRKSVEDDPVNHFVKKVRTQGWDWRRISDHLNAKYNETRYTCAAVYGRFVRNAPRIAALEGDTDFCVDDWINLKPNGEQRRGRQRKGRGVLAPADGAGVGKRIDRGRLKSVVDAMLRKDAGFWDMVADELDADLTGGECFAEWTCGSGVQ